jgi:dipeptidyl aminopeptidase/acylaminoacyl peptidase
MTLMTAFRRAALVVLVPAVVVAQPVPKAKAAIKPDTVKHEAVKQYTIEQFMDTVALRGASFSADESRILFSSNKTGIFNVYSVPVAGGEPTAITTSTTDTIYAVSYFPKDDRILFTRDQGGNELNHLFVRTTEGQEKDLTPGEKLRATFMGFSHDDTAFFVQTNERDQRYFDIYRYDAASYERTLLYKNEAGLLPAVISEDGKWIALIKPNTTNDSDILLWSAETKEATLISKHDGTANHQPATFDPTSHALYYLTDSGSEFTVVKRYDLASGQHEDVQKADWDIVYTFFSRDGKYRVTGVNQDGRTVITVADAKTNRPISLPVVPDGTISGVTISRSETRMAFYVNGDRSPSNLYVHALGTPKVTRLTNTLNPDINTRDLVEAQVVRFKSFDGMTVPSIYYKPKQATPQHKAPALVWVHGGPGGQTTRGYSAAIQYLVNHGYVILGINNRGSSGYGKTFLAADDQKHGKEPLWDCVEGKKYLASLPYVDPNKIGIMGGSYGGYMTLAALSFQPDAFAVGVDLFGVANWVRTLESIPSWWEAQRKALYAEMGDPNTQRDMLKEISPLFHTESIRKPLLVLQGANDPRVLKVESDEIVAAVKKNNVPVEYIVFPDEGHGFTKKKNQIEGYGAVLKFLDTYLKSAAAPAPSSASNASTSERSGTPVNAPSRVQLTAAAALANCKVCAVDQRFSNP